MIISRSFQKTLLTALILAPFASTAFAQRVTVANNPMDLEPAAGLDHIELPPGFEISIYADNVIRGRTMALGEDNVLYVGTRGSYDGSPVGKVYAVIDEDGDRKADKVLTIAEGLNTPNGVALHEGDLYIAEISRILRLDNIGEHLNNPPEPTVVNDNYPTEGHHGWKFIRFGPDDKLYVPVGAPCNTCEPDEIFASITRLNPDGSDREVIAHGIRNTVGFDWHPETGNLWFTDNGRDMWGNTKPPEELNRVTEEGQHFGFPYRYGTDLVDDQYQTDMKADAFTPPVAEFPAHTAGLGMEFYTGDAFPDEYAGDIFIANHGSWNRKPPEGYYITRVDMEGDQIKGTEVFAKGWLQNEKYWGRPVDVEFLPDGSMLVSDDHANVIYRIHYTGE